MKQSQKDQGNPRLEIKETDIDLLHLLHELFEAQQLAHRFYLELKKIQIENNLYAEQIQRLSLALPRDWSDEQLILLGYTHENNQPVWHFRFENAELADIYVSGLDFYVTGSHGAAGLLIKEPHKNVRAIGFPFKANQSDIFLQPAAGSLTQPANLAISNLSPAEWRFFCEIVRKLKTIIETPNGKTSYPNDAYLVHSLNNTMKALAAWPLILRYENIDLVNITNNTSELSLQIRLTNLELGHYQWESLTYVIGTKELEHCYFGADPFLKFPPESQQAFDYAQQPSTTNKLLDFSFRTNQAFEQVLWDRLSEKDRLLLASLASSLPRQLESIENNGNPIPKGISAWTMIAQRIRHIFNNANLSRSN